MASITFVGPGGTDTVVLQVDDAFMTSVIDGVCGLEGYTGDSPGLFTIKKTIEIWKHQAREWATRLATDQMNLTLDQQLAMLNQVTTTVNGQAVDLSQVTKMAIDNFVVQ